jgi:hypothetical protein
MRTTNRIRLLTTTAAVTAGLAAPLFLAAGPASAHGAGARASGACMGQAAFQLKAKHDDARIELEYEVDSNHAGQVWKVRITDNGATVVSRNATTVAPSGSFTVHKVISNRRGSDTIRARATFRAQTCRGTVQL